MRRSIAFAVGITLTAAALSGCASSGETPASTNLAVGSTDLSSVCPSTIVIQTNWHPEAEHGALYQLLGDNYDVDTDLKAVRGPLMASGGYTGVDVEIRAGGPAIGYQQVSSLMYTDSTITLGYVATDEAVANSGTLPTVGVFGSLTKSPTMIMWDPAAYPDVKGIADLKKKNVTVRTFQGAAYSDYLVQSGLLSEEQIDPSYDGTPATFVADGGTVAQQGFASSEPYQYENEITQWAKPVAYQLVYDTGWQPYEGVLAVKADKLEQLSNCLAALVPVIQQANVDFLTDPKPAIGRILAAVDAYNNGWSYNEAGAEYAVATMIDKSLVGDGSFDLHRVDDFISKATGIYEHAGVTMAPDLKASDIATNRFIDPDIKLP
ncbi:nitrate ABC transporter substrate-binding protein [soil metagenome]